MKNFIRELYFGNIDPQAKSFVTDSDYGRAMAVVGKNEELLTAKLKGDDQKAFQDYIDACGEVPSITAFETYAEGFRTGASFVFDTFLNNESGVFKNLIDEE